MIKFLDLQHQYKSIKKEIDSKIFEVIQKSAFIGGEYVAEFEQNFAKFCDAKHCIGVGNGTDALEVSLWSLNLPKNSEVIVPANSFIATSEAVSRNGLNIKFVDCDEYYQMCPRSLENIISDKTSAILVVHLYGHTANMEEIVHISKQHNLKLIEDCAQAHGAKYKGKSIGTFGDIATFSFYPGKNLGAYGDAGAIVTNDKDLASKCKQYANHGRSSKFGHEFEGINSRLDGLQAAILNVKLAYLPSWIKRRNEIAELYLKNIKNADIILPKVNKDTSHVWHLFVIQHPQRDKLSEFLTKNNIQNGIHYPIALPKLKAYTFIEQKTDSFFACKVDKDLLSLPIGEHLTNKEVDQIITILNKTRY